MPPTVTRIYKLEAPRESFDGAVQNADLCVHLTQRKIIAGEFRGDDQASVL